MSLNAFTVRQTSTAGMVVVVGSGGIAIACLGIVSGSGSPLIKRTTDEWISATTTVMSTPDALGYAVFHGYDVGSGVVLVNRRDFLAGTARSHNVYRSTDSGAAWSLATLLETFDLSGTDTRRMSPFAHLANGDLLLNTGYYDSGVPTDVSTLWRSQNQGATWATLTDMVAAGVFTADGTAPAGAFCDMIAFGTTVVGLRNEFIWRSTNSGATWSLVHTSTAGDLGFCLVDLDGGTTLLAFFRRGVDTVVKRSTDGGATWASLSMISAATTFTTNFSFKPFVKIASNQIIGITRDMNFGTSGKLVYSADGGATWATPFSDGSISGDWTAFVLPSTRRGFSADATAQQRIYTETAAPIAPQMNPVVNAGSGRLYAMFPQAAATIKAFASTDQGLTWAQVADVADLRGAATPPTSKLRSPVAGQLLLGLKGNVSGPTVARSLDSGSSWAGLFTLAGDNVWDNFAVLREPVPTPAGEICASPIRPQLFMDSEATSKPVPMVPSSNLVTWNNNTDGIVAWLNDQSEVVEWLTAGLALTKENAPLFGHYLGWTIRGRSIPYRIETVTMEYAPSREWDTTTR